MQMCQKGEKSVFDMQQGLASFSPRLDRFAGFATSAPDSKVELFVPDAQKTDL